jgi:glycosyltransferase involved in cell wall biosynthesis
MLASSANEPRRISVIVAARLPPDTLEQSLSSLAQQRCLPATLEVIVADGSSTGSMAAVAARVLPSARHLWLPGANLPALKGAAIRSATTELVAVLDPSDAAEPDWASEIQEAFSDDTLSAVGGSVSLAGAKRAGNIAAYLFEYGAFNAPLAAGPTSGDLPGNNVAYRRSALVDDCRDILEAEGFNKPFFHERLRALGGQLVIRPSMRVRHLTNYRLLPFGMRRFHYGRCFGATRVRRAPLGRKALLRAFAPVVPALLVTRHLMRAVRHSGSRRLLPHAGLALCGVCAFWGFGEWLGCWFGAGDSCQELF